MGWPVVGEGDFPSPSDALRTVRMMGENVAGRSRLEWVCMPPLNAVSRRLIWEALVLGDEPMTVSGREGSYWCDCLFDAQGVLLDGLWL